MKHELGELVLNRLRDQGIRQAVIDGILAICRVEPDKRPTASDMPAAMFDSSSNHQEDISEPTLAPSPTTAIPALQRSCWSHDAWRWRGWRDSPTSEGVGGIGGRVAIARYDIRRRL